MAKCVCVTCEEYTIIIGESMSKCAKISPFMEYARMCVLSMPIILVANVLFEVELMWCEGGSLGGGRH